MARAKKATESEQPQPQMTAPQPNENGTAPDDVPAINADENEGAGLGQPFIKENRYTPSANVLEFFLSFNPIPEEMWIRAGLSEKQIAVKRRIFHNYNFIKYGITDVMGDQMLSLSAWAGRDGRARREAVEVATQRPDVVLGQDAMRAMYNQVSGRELQEPRKR